LELTFHIADVMAEPPDGADGPVTVAAAVKNTGATAGAEVVQVYVGVPVHGQPPKRLAGFQKVFVPPGQLERVTITIDPAVSNHPFGVWDYCTQRFVTKPGDYILYVGTSADDTPHTVQLSVGMNVSRPRALAPSVDESEEVAPTRYCAVRPPSMICSVPVTYDDSSDASQTMRFATSSVAAIRPSGTCDEMPPPSSSVAAAIIGVLM
jgi:hypothetical protein